MTCWYFPIFIKFNKTFSIFWLINFYAPMRKIIKPLEIFPHADWPIHWYTGNSKNFFQFRKQIKWFTSITVKFIDESENWNSTTFDNLEKFFRLCFNPFSTINN